MITLTIVAVPLVAIAWVARLFRSGIEESAWRLVVLAMLAIPIASQLPKIDVGIDLAATEVVFDSAPPLLLGTHAPTWLLIPTVLLIARLVIAAIRTRNVRDVRVPVVVGLLRPRIVLPAGADSWTREKRDAIVAHESAHVRRRDPLWRFLAQLGIALFWFHPIAWLAAAALERLAEEAADREGVAAVGDRHRYAGVLLDIARSMTSTNRRVLAAAMLDRRSLTRRVDAILDARSAARPPRLAYALLIVLTSGTVFAATMTKHEVATPYTFDGHRLRDEIRSFTRDTTRSFFRSLFR